MAIPEVQIEEIRERNNIVEVISEYIQIKRAGANFKALCPFHSEKTPSFMISPAKQIFHCFGCGAGGNVIKFVQMIEGISFIDSVKKLAVRAGIIIKEDKETKDSQGTSLRKRLFEINKKLAEYYHQNLLRLEESSLPKRYLKKRGISENTLKKYMLGFSFSNDTKLFETLKKSMGKEEDILQSGNFFQTNDGRYIDRFYDRLIFPIFDIYNRIVGFGGRILSSSTEKSKYINSTDSPVFKKSSTLYGINFGKNDIRKLNKAFVVEGYFDVITLQEAGILNSIASSGTALTIDQVHILKRFTEFATLIYDADSAGINAAIRGAKIFEEENLYVDLISLPPGEDPDSFVRKSGKDGFLSVTSKAIDIYGFRLNDVFSKCNKQNRSDQIKAYKNSLEILSEIKNPVLLKNNVYSVSKFFGIDEGVIQKNIKEQKKIPTAGTAADSTVIRKRKKNINDIASEELIKSLIEFPEKLTFIEDKVKPNLIKNDILKEIFIKLCTFIKEHSYFKLSAFLDYVQNPELEKTITEIALDDLKIEESKVERAICDYITQLQKNSISEQLKDLKETISLYKKTKDPRLPEAMQKYLNLKKSEKNQLTKNIHDMHKFMETSEYKNNLV